MLILTITPPHAPSRTVTFTHTPIVIGSRGADLLLPEESLQEIHIKLIAQGDHILAINAANDPFVTLNDLPFGKRAINDRDQLQIGKTKISIHISQEAVEQLPPIDTDALLREVEQWDVPQSPPTPIASIEPPPPPVESVPPAPEAVVEEEAVEPVVAQLRVESEDSSPDVKEELPTPWSSHQERRSWRAFFVTCAIILTLLAVTATGVFVRVSLRSEKEKIIASEGVADVAMALAYAQVNHIKPQKQNWFDPDFLTNNLASILSSSYPSFANIDHQGQFRNCRYLLRIYTNSDLSQFLVMAQPEPSLLQWLVPKATIVVSSMDMELRSFYDVKPLNRLLVNPNTLDATNAREIVQLIKQGTPIPLLALGAKKGFAPPKSLVLIRPGAENFIYNAPRYYHFGEMLLKKAVMLLQINGNTHEITRLQQQLENLAHFPDLILYSSQGMQKALQSQRALVTLAPQYKFLTAYLSFTAEGTVASSHLLLDADHHDPLNPFRSDSGDIALLAPEQKSDLDQRHPLLLQLYALAHDRQEALRAISDNITALLKSRNEGTTNTFSKRMRELLYQYEQEDQRYQMRIADALQELYRQHAEMPLAQFTAYVKKAGLEPLAQESLAIRARQPGMTQLTPARVTLQMQKLQKTQDFEQLEEAVSETAELLTLHHLPNPEKLIAYQNEMRTQTLQQLSRFMLSSQTKLPQRNFNQENRAILSHILKTAWVTDPEEWEFYLNEFDQLSDTHHVE